MMAQVYFSTGAAMLLLRAACIGGFNLINNGDTNMKDLLNKVLFVICMLASVQGLSWMLGLSESLLHTGIVYAFLFDLYFNKQHKD